MDIQYDKLIDAKDLRCPQPLLLAKHGINLIEIGQIILLEATDPHTDLDLEVWCQRFKHEIIHTMEVNNVLKFWIRKV